MANKISKNTRYGGVILIAIGISLAIGVMLVALQTLAPQLRRETVRSESLLQLRLTLSSLVDYMAFQVKKRSCLDESLIEKTPCQANDPYLTERLLLNEESSSFMYDTNRSLFASDDDVALSSITFSINPQNISSRHPLYSVFERIKDEVGSAKVVVTRVDSLYTPTTSDQIFIKIRATITKKQSSTGILSVAGFGLRQELHEEAIFAVYRRELGSMALVVAGNLRLDKSSPTLGSSGSSVAGEAQIATISRTQINSSRGIVFQSPIFVNKNIVLPSAENSNTEYSDVRFNDTVFIGRGLLVRDNKPYSPARNADNGLQTWSNLNFMGGFMNGIQIDGENDPGLSYFISEQIGTSTNSQLVNQCIERNQTLVSLTNTKHSQLVFKPISSSSPNSNHQNIKLKLGFSQSNEFFPQNGGGYPEKLTSSNTDSFLINGSPEWVAQNGANAPILDVDLKIGSHTIQSSLGFDSSWSAKLNVTDNIRNDYTTAQNQLQNINAQISNAQNTIAQNPSSPSSIALQNSLNPGGQLHTAQIQAQTTFNQRETQKNLFFNADGSIQENAPHPEIKISIEGIKISDAKNVLRTQPNQAILDIVISNKEYLNLNELTFNVKGFDIGTDLNGRSLRLRNNNSINPELQAQGRSKNGLFQFIKNPGTGNFELQSSNPSSSWKAALPTDNQTLVWSTSDKNGVGNIGQPINEAFNYGELMDACNATVEGQTSAFARADWNARFAQYTRSSWIFANPTPSTISHTNWRMGNTSYYAIQGPQNFTAMENKFQVRSIVDSCHIAPSENLIVGFFTCDNLTIGPRTTPLTIIGSIIAGHVSIDRAAVIAGINWYSIYHPEAIEIMRNNRILNDMNGDRCDLTTTPIWHPYPSFNQLSQIFQCTPLALRSKADNWTWTQVNPEQAVINGNPTRRPMPQRFLIKEISRNSNL